MSGPVTWVQIFLEPENIYSGKDLVLCWCSVVLSGEFCLVIIIIIIIIICAIRLDLAWNAVFEVSFRMALCAPDYMFRPVTHWKSLLQLGTVDVLYTSVSLQYSIWDVVSSLSQLEWVKSSRKIEIGEYHAIQSISAIYIFQQLSFMTLVFYWPPVDIHSIDNWTSLWCIDLYNVYYTAVHSNTYLPQ